jgi:hypothetical protein
MPVEIFSGIESLANRPEVGNVAEASRRLSLIRDRNRQLKSSCLHRIRIRIRMLTVTEAGSCF